MVNTTRAANAPATAAQMHLIHKLCKQLNSDKKYVKLNREDASKIIKQLITRQERATPAQVQFVADLKRGAGESLGGLENLTRAEARETINRLKPHKTSPYVPPNPGARIDLEPGVYQMPSGDVYRVYPPRVKGRRPYAKRLVETTGNTHRYKLVYEAGATSSLLPGMRMTLEQAAAWGRKTGSCCACGAVLVKEESIAAGIGPVCAERF